jgi:hypothetical protein
MVPPIILHRPTALKEAVQDMHALAMYVNRCFEEVKGKTKPGKLCYKMHPVNEVYKDFTNALPVMGRCLPCLLLLLVC